MKVFVTGGSGFVGRTLCGQLIKAGHQVTVLSRSAKASDRLPPQAGLAIGDPSQPGPWQREAAKHHGFVNLAGASIFKRWSQEYKASIKSSRLETTRNLVAALGQGEGGGKVLVSTSAVGYYGFRGDEELDESATPGSDFLARVCQDWEKEAFAAEENGVRVVTTRFGIVLGAGGGAFERMLPAFRLGLGGPLGSGRQWFSWIHLADLVSGIVFCLENEQMQGPANFCAPNPVTNREFSKTLGSVLSRPAFLKAPSFAIKLALGELGSVLLQGQRVIPEALLKAGFEFKYPELAGALTDLTGRGREPGGV